jgi:hypothetical protein
MQSLISETYEGHKEKDLLGPNLTFSRKLSQKKGPRKSLTRRRPF